MREYLVGILIPALVLIKFGATPITLALLPSAIVSYKLFITDLLHRKLPNALIYPTYLVSLAIIIFFSLVKSNLDLFTSPILISSIALIFGLIIYLFSRGKFGAGDVKLMSLCGLVLGLFSIEYLLITGLIAFLGLLITALVLLGFKKATPQTFIPFGPFLIFATWLVILVFG